MNPHFSVTDLLTRLYGRAIEFAFLVRQQIRCIGIGTASLWWKAALFYEDVELGPAAKPVLAYSWPELGLGFFCRIVGEDGNVAAKECELLAGSPVRWRHVEKYGKMKLRSKPGR